jgi:predicted DNA-binding protein with PD1-like motif
VKVGIAADTLIVRLEVGDDILASVAAVCREHHIDNAVVSGIGSVEAVTLAHYRRDTQKFTQRAFEGIYEIVSLLGNVALVGGQPALHCHVTIADAEMTPQAGHLAAGVCSATVELIIRRLDSHFAKQLNEDIGLPLWQL